MNTALDNWFTFLAEYDLRLRHIDNDWVVERYMDRLFGGWEVIMVASTVYGLMEALLESSKFYTEVPDELAQTNLRDGHGHTSGLLP